MSSHLSTEELLGPTKWVLGHDDLLTKAGGFSVEVRRLFDLYLHNDIDRRTFLERAGSLTGEGYSAERLLEQLRTQFAENH